MIDLQTVNDLGINEILNNDIDFPIDAGLYSIETPSIIYYPPYDNNTIKNGILSWDGNIYKKFLKRSRVLYLPTKIYNDDDTITNLKNDFIVPEGRALTGYPVLAYSYIITHLDENDKLIWMKNNM